MNTTDFQRELNFLTEMFDKTNKGTINQTDLKQIVEHFNSLATTASDLLGKQETTTSSDEDEEKMTYMNNFNLDTTMLLNDIKEQTVSSKKEFKALILNLLENLKASYEMDGEITEGLMGFFSYKYNEREVLLLIRQKEKSENDDKELFANVVYIDDNKVTHGVMSTYCLEFLNSTIETYFNVINKIYNDNI